MRTSKHLYIACTKDEYELPVFIEDTSIALSKKLGVAKSAILMAIKRNQSSRGYKIKRVEI